MKYCLTTTLFLALLLSCTSANESAVADSSSPSGVLYLTTSDSTSLLQPRSLEIATEQGIAENLITVNRSQRFQTMDGFGFTLTGGSAELIHALPAVQRKALLEELFGLGEEAIGISYLRLSVGASDLDAEVFSYDDPPGGVDDPELEYFSLDPDRQHLIPVLREILLVNPEMKLMASPWSPPVWMKDNRNSIGGSLKEEHYGIYADYFVRYLEDMGAEGIRIDAVTVQNEPLHPGNNPSLLMLAEEQAVFVGQHLGPAFAAAGLETKIIIYDHNADRPDYPITILEDSLANRYVHGSAFHLYGGPISALSQVHEAFPDKHLYFTEQWIGAPGDFAGDFRWHTRELIIGAPRNWSKTVLEWNLAADENQLPHTDGGCTKCLGALTIEGDKVTRNTAYYIIAHAAKFVRPGAIRIGTNLPEGLPNVAYETPAGDVVALVLNDTDAPKSFGLEVEGNTFRAKLGPGDFATLVIQ